MTPKTGQHTGRNLEVPRVAACTGLRKDLGGGGARCRSLLCLYGLLSFLFLRTCHGSSAGVVGGNEQDAREQGRVPTVVEQYVPRFSFGRIDELRRVRCDVCCCVWCTFAFLLCRGGLKAGGGVSLVSDVRYLGVVTGRKGCRSAYGAARGRSVERRKYHQALPSLSVPYPRPIRPLSESPDGGAPCCVVGQARHW